MCPVREDLNGYERDAPRSARATSGCRSSAMPAPVRARSPWRVLRSPMRTAGCISRCWPPTAPGSTVAYRKMWLGDAEARRFTPGPGAGADVDGWRLGLAIKFCARGLPPSGGSGIASPSLLLPCYADGACILASWFGRWRFQQAGCMTSDCTWSGARSTAAVSLGGQVGVRLRELIDVKAAGHGWRSSPARSCPTTCTCS